jgi:hypothetical protein
MWLDDNCKRKTMRFRIDTLSSVPNKLIRRTDRQTDMQVERQWNLKYVSWHTAQFLYAKLFPIQSLCIISLSGNINRGPQFTDQFTVNFMFSQRHHMSLMDFVVSPPGCGRRVTDFWGWDAHEEQLRSPDEVDSDIWIWSNKRGIKPNFH